MYKKLTILFTILFVVLCIAGIASAGDPACLVLSPTDAGPNDEVTADAYDTGDNWVDLSTYESAEFCFGSAGCVDTDSENLDISSGSAVFTISSDQYNSDTFDVWINPGRVWFTLANPGESSPFDYVYEAIADGGDCDLSEDTDPPTPDPMTWATAPAGLTTTSITMTATTASDQSGVEYYFEETSDNPGGDDSIWQDSETYTDSGLSALTEYCYRVRARDKSANQNTGDWSTPDACSESAAAGETLYNGIVLPQTWPPDYGSVPYEPMPVPYLDDPPATVLIDVGRQLFVDDFLIDTTDMTQTYHQATYYAQNPVLAPTTVREFGDGSWMAGPFSGGSWYDPDDSLYKMWYRGGQDSTGIYGSTMCYATSTDGKNWDRPDLDVLPTSPFHHFTCTPSNPSDEDPVTIAVFDEYDQQVDLGDWDLIEFCWGSGTFCVDTTSGITIDGNGGAVFTCTEDMFDYQGFDFWAYKGSPPPETEIFSLPFPFDTIARGGNTVYPWTSNDANPIDSTSILLDHNAAASERFKYFVVEFPGSGTELSYRKSSDGINWSAPLSTKSVAGDRTTVFYNPFRDVWVCSQRSDDASGRRCRVYTEATSAADLMSKIQFNQDDDATGDSVHWVGADPCDPRHTDPCFSSIEPELYTLDAMPYESIMLGQFSIWTGPSNTDCDTYWVPKRNDILLGFSRDGFHWDRPDRTRFIACTWDDQSWRMGNLQSCVGSPLVVGDELYFYFNARPKPAPNARSWDKDFHTGLAILRRDGFASMDASGAKTLTTRPVKFTDGKYLFVNTDCPSGSLKVEVLNEASEVISPFTLANCDAISADTTCTQVTWGENDDLSSLQADPNDSIRFRFTLDDGSLYAFWVSPDASGASYGYVGGGGPGFTGPTDTVGPEEPEGGDTTPPTPNPMTWASVPTADDQDSISMTATTATDPNGVEYYFMETSSNPGGDDSGWQDPANYTDDGLNSGTQYCYKVQARDKSVNQNLTGWSTPDACAETESPPGPLFEDGFEVSEWNGVWTEDAQNDWAWSDHEHDGSYSARVDGDATDATLTTVGNIDVSGSSTVTVDCWWWIDDQFDNGEYLKCEYKLDSDSWTELDSLDGNVDTENYWHHLQLDVNTSGKSNMLLRFKGKMSKSNEDAYVDTVKVNHKN